MAVEGYDKLRRIQVPLRLLPGQEHPTKEQADEWAWKVADLVNWSCDELNLPPVGRMVHYEVDYHRYENFPYVELRAKCYVGAPSARHAL
jgi:hypothetical protein